MFTPRPWKAEYRKHVGPEALYDLIAANQFIALIKNGLREHHFVLDVGCGSLRVGRLLINYLLPERYFGIEPNKEVIRAAIKKEIGLELEMLKAFAICHDADFNLNYYPVIYDYILAHSIFSHATKAQLEKCIAKAKKVLHPDGKFLATYIEGPDNEAESWTYPAGVTFSYETINHICRINGMKCVKMKLKHPGNQTWIRIEHA